MQCIYESLQTFWTHRRLSGSGFLISGLGWRLWDVTFKYLTKRRREMWFWSKRAELTPLFTNYTVFKTPVKYTQTPQRPFHRLNANWSHAMSDKEHPQNMKQVNDMIMLKLKTRNLAVPTLLVKKSELLKSSIHLGILLACCIKKVFSYVLHHGGVQETEFFHF